MLDFENIEKYRENNRIEAKKALGGLPHSLWETYSAFANTLGGYILLGVEEYKDHSLHPIDLPDPEGLVREFWTLVNNTKKASVNILSDKDVTIENAGGKHIICIHVPRAERTLRPVYVDGNPLNSYRRNGEGDYRCTKEDISAMIRDASVKTQDMLVLESMDLSAFNYESVRAYRRRMEISRPGHVWGELPDDEFLLRMRCVGIGEDGRKHPTSAGLLMFGNEYDIVREYPRFFLDYREEHDDVHRWTDRIFSSSGDWSGNLIDFYFRTYNKLQLDLKTPFVMDGPLRVDDTESRKAVREALANCIVNADYYGRGGLVVIKKRDEITMRNPGRFRVDMDAARDGGFSDPRNSVILQLFNMIDIGERAGSGIPKIYRAWHDEGLAEPTISEKLDPDCTTLSLPLRSVAVSERRPFYSIAPNTGSMAREESSFFDGYPVVESVPLDEIALAENALKNTAGKTSKERIISYITENVVAGNAELCRVLGLKSSRVKTLLRELCEEDILVPEGENRGRKYRLKSY